MYNLSDNICCSVHTLLWTAAARIFVALDFVQLHKIRLPQSIQRWTFCKDIVLLVVWRNVAVNGVADCPLGGLEKCCCQWSSGLFMDCGAILKNAIVGGAEV